MERKNITASTLLSRNHTLTQPCLVVLLKVPTAFIIHHFLSILIKTNIAVETEKGGRG